MMKNDFLDIDNLPLSSSLILIHKRRSQQITLSQLLSDFTPFITTRASRDITKPKFAKIKDIKS